MQYSHILALSKNCLPADRVSSSSWSDRLKLKLVFEKADCGLLVPSKF